MSQLLRPSPSSHSVGDRLALILEARFPLSQRLRPLIESPPVRALSAALDSFNAWAARPDVQATLRAIYDWVTVDSRLQAYRERWESEGIPVTLQEAEHALHCLRYAAFNEQVDPVRYLVHELGETPSEDAVRRYIHLAESKAIYWDALAEYKCALTQGSEGYQPLPSSWPPEGAKRPNASGRPPRWIFRNENLIPEAIQKLSGCGLPVTSHEGDSLAKAVANVFDLAARHVAAIWEVASTRADKRSRKRYASQPCRMCGDVKVSTWRAKRDDFRCERCAPRDSEDT